MVPGVRVYGGLVFNETCGGWAESRGGTAGASDGCADNLDANTFSPQPSTHHGLRRHFHPGRARKPLPAAEEILRAIAQSDCIVGTGHLSPEETSVLIDLAGKLGVQKILVTHPEWGPRFTRIKHRRILPGSQTYSLSDASFPQPTSAVPSHSRPSSAPLSRAASNARFCRPILDNRRRRPPPRAYDFMRNGSGSSGFSVDHIRAMMATNPERLLWNRPPGP